MNYPHLFSFPSQRQRGGERERERGGGKEGERGSVLQHSAEATAELMKFKAEYLVSMQCAVGSENSYMRAVTISVQNCGARWVLSNF